MWFFNKKKKVQNTPGANQLQLSQQTSLVHTRRSDRDHLMSPSRLLEMRQHFLLQEAMEFENAFFNIAMGAFQGKSFKMGWCIIPTACGRPFHEEAIQLAHERLESVGWKIKYEHTEVDRAHNATLAWYTYGSGLEEQLEKSFEEAKGLPAIEDKSEK